MRLLRICMIPLILTLLLTPAAFSFERTYTLPRTPETINEYTRFCKMMDDDPETCLKRQRYAMKKRWTVRNERGVEDIHRYFGMCIAKNRGVVQHGFRGEEYIQLWAWDAHGTLECITKVQEDEKKRRSGGEKDEDSLEQEPGPDQGHQGGTGQTSPAI